MLTYRLPFILFLLRSSVSCEDYFVRDAAIGGEVSEYLDALSEFKPIKCSEAVLNTRNEDLDSDAWILSRSCLSNEMWEPFHFSGQINEHDQFSGPGKFIVQERDSFEHKGQFGTCLDFPKVFEKELHIISAVGTFLNGTLHGKAKVMFSNGNTAILSFKNGVPHGLRRDFDSQKNLLSAGMVSNGSPVGYIWTKMSDDFFLLDYRHTNDTIREKKVDLYSSLLFNIKNKTFLGGTYPRYMENLYHVYSPASLKFDKDSEKCMKELSWEKVPSSKEIAYSLTFLSFVPNSLSEFFLKTSNLSAPQRLKRFRKYLVSHKTTIAYSFLTAQGPVNKDDKVLFLENITRTQGHKAYEGVFQGTKVKLRHHRGLVDADGNIHGNTWLEIQYPWGLPKNRANDMYINYIGVQFFHGKIRDGSVVLGFQDYRYGYAYISSGCLHGPLVIEGAVPILPVKHMNKKFQNVGSCSVYIYKNGRRESPFWIGMVGLGALTGSFNESGYITGEKIAYLYPDMETSYIGNFEDKIMREAYLGDVVSVSWKDGLIPTLGFKMSTEETRPFYYEPPTNGSLGAGPHILDPYDAKRVYISDAGEFGEGVIAKVDMEVGDIACLYSYQIYYPEDRDYYRESCAGNTTKTADERRHCIKYALAIQILDATLNIPPEKDTPDMFLPTLGMKLNHKFYESHASFMDVESPRWGIISSIALYFKPVIAGEQIFVDYGYKTRGDFPADFLWFWELKDSVDAEIKAKKKAEAKKQKKLLKRKNKATSNKK